MSKKHRIVHRASETDMETDSDTRVATAAPSTVKGITRAPARVRVEWMVGQTGHLQNSPYGRLKRGAYSIEFGESSTRLALLSQASGSEIWHVRMPNFLAPCRAPFSIMDHALSCTHIHSGSSLLHVTLRALTPRGRGASSVLARQPLPAWQARTWRSATQDVPPCT
eukprot:774518-Prymnesium_polylepis.1